MNIYVFQPVLYLIAVTKYCVAFFLHFFVFIFDEEYSEERNVEYWMRVQVYNVR